MPEENKVDPTIKDNVANPPPKEDLKIDPSIKEDEKNKPDALTAITGKYKSLEKKFERLEAEYTATKTTNEGLQALLKKVGITGEEDANKHLDVIKKSMTEEQWKATQLEKLTKETADLKAENEKIKIDGSIDKAINKAVSKGLLNGYDTDKIFIFTKAMLSQTENNAEKALELVLSGLPKVDQKSKETDFKSNGTITNPDNGRLIENGIDPKTGKITNYTKYFEFRKTQRTGNN